jgi:hypothetical protein
MAITVKDHEKMAASAGFTGQAIDLIVKAGAQARHGSRVDDTANAALAAADGCSLTAAFLLALDVHRIGGELGISGGSTTRYFVGLGKGRWHASDGPAYMAAAEQAIRRFQTSTGTNRWIVATATAAGVQIRWSDYSGAENFDWEWFPVRGLCPWIKAELGRAVLATLIEKTGDADFGRHQYCRFIHWEDNPAALSIALEAVHNSHYLEYGCAKMDAHSGEVVVTYGTSGYYDYAVMLPGEEYPDEAPEVQRLLEADGLTSLYNLGIMLVDGDTPNTSRLEFAQ